MKRDILACRELGCPGIVTGVQRNDGSLDGERMKRLVDLANGMEVTCHKVFDGVPNVEEALETLVEAGCARVLTSGLQANAMEGARTIKQLVARSAGRIVVMPGGGVRAANIAELIAATGAVEYHSSAITDHPKGHDADRNDVEALVHALRNGAIGRQ